jgi:hypothetical protein
MAKLGGKSGSVGMLTPGNGTAGMGGIGGKGTSKLNDGGKLGKLGSATPGNGTAGMGGIGGKGTSKLNDGGNAGIAGMLIPGSGMLGRGIVKEQLVASSRTMHSSRTSHVQNVGGMSIILATPRPTR